MWVIMELRTYKPNSCHIYLILEVMKLNVSMLMTAYLMLLDLNVIKKNTQMFFSFADCELHM